MQTHLNQKRIPTDLTTLGTIRIIARTKVNEIAQQLDDWSCLPGEVTIAKQIREKIREKNFR